MSGSEPRGSELLRAVAVMEALRAPDGDAWSALQTHHSLARYLLEETHEVLEAIQEEGPAKGSLPDELGDLLFQILFHARLGQEEQPAWDIDDVARAFVAKMERRNPHVFGSDREDALEDPRDVEQIIAQWHAVKAEEKAELRAEQNAEQRGEQAPEENSAAEDGAAGAAWFAGIPHALPALQSAAKTIHRARSDGGLDQLTAAAEQAAQAEDSAQWGGDLALALLEVAREAEARDVDPESALRTLLSRTRDRSS